VQGDRFSYRGFSLSRVAGKGRRAARALWVTWATNVRAYTRCILMHARGHTEQATLSHLDCRRAKISRSENFLRCLIILGPETSPGPVYHHSPASRRKMVGGERGETRFASRSRSLRSHWEGTSNYNRAANYNRLLTRLYALYKIARKQIEESREIAIAPFF